MKLTLRFVKAAFALLICALLAPAFPSGALALPQTDPLFFADLNTSGFEFSYTPPVNSDYALYLFSADGGEVHAHAELYENGSLIASGEGHGAILSEWLVAGINYTVRVNGRGNAAIEMARNTLSRCHAQPLDLTDGQRRGKMIARSYDAHWHAFEAAKDAHLLISVLPEDAGMHISAMLFDENGSLIAQFDPLQGGGCMLDLTTEAGRRYYIRICSPGGDTGYYNLQLNRPSSASPQPPAFMAHAITVTAGSSLNLSAQASGEIAFWVSSDPATVHIDQSGRITALKAGTAAVTAYGHTSAARISIEVVFVPLKGLEILGNEIRLAAGDDTALQLVFTPENASDLRVSFALDDPGIAAIDEYGVLTALSEGTTLLHVVSADGEFTDSIPITVTPATRKYRALLISQQNYPESVNTVRNGSENSVNAIHSMLDTARFESAAYITRSVYDLSRAELIYELRQTFSGATEQDVSLIYISSHGFYSGGMSFLELCDGSVMSARDLERELRAIPGTIVLLVDCCGSGGMIGKSSDYADFTRGMTTAFSSAAVSGSKYKVICSAGYDENSYRIAFNENASSGVMATVFARALCDGAGWDIDENRRGTLSADQNYNGNITLNELYMYMQTRVNWYLGIAADMTGSTYRQNIQMYPEGDPLVIFERRTNR